MKTNFSLSIVCIFFALFSCNSVDSQDDIVPSSTSVKESTDNLTDIVLSERMVDFAALTNFKEDNELQACMRDGLPYTISASERIRIRPTFPEDMSKMKDWYPSVKRQLLLLMKDQDCQLNPEVQYVVQGLMRKYLLLENTDESKEEAKFLLLKYLYTKPVDMDVLADTYRYVESILTGDEKNQVLKYMSDAYSHNVSYLPQKIQEVKDAIEELSDAPNRNFKRIELQSLLNSVESNKYAGEVLGFDTSGNR